MKKWILVYDAGECICSVEVTVDNTKPGTPVGLVISFQGKEYNIMYVVGMDYGIVVPERIPGIDIEDIVNLH